MGAEMRAVELFGCSGGMAEGFRRAGITFDFTFDRDPDACASYTTNLGHAPVQIDVRDLLRMVRGGWSPGPLDLLVADPPCTPWSRAGKRGGLDDERDLLQETAELIALLQPRAYLIANVPGLDDGPHLPVVQRVIGGLGKRGYCVGDFARLDAADYGVPQHRVRPFWFGHRGGACLTWPVRTHGLADPKQLTCIDPLRPSVTCRDALGHLPLEQLGRPVHEGRRKNARHPPSRGDKPARTVVAGSGLGSRDAIAWPWDRPATTVDIKDVLAPYGRNGRDGSSQRGNPNAILLSERAKAILQGFPDGWHFAGKTKGSRHAQIGMAMPQPLAEPVARCIARWLETNP